MQLEKGSIATDFENRSIAEELALCQRYYWRSATGVSNAVIASGFMNSTTDALCYTAFPVTMRAVPSMSTSGTFQVMQVASITGTIVFSVPYKDGVRVGLTVVGGVSGNGALIRNAADPTAYIAADAEL